MLTRTTAPRLVDATAEIPTLAGLARTATRLHPRLGAPTVHDSSVGGPLLWPADEPWPMNPLTQDPEPPLTTLADVRALRALLTQAWSRTRGPRENLLTPEQGELVDRLSVGTLTSAPSGPSPLLPLAQLYARDVPVLPCPKGTDLLQVLWTPGWQIEGCSAAVQLRWRWSGDVRDVLISPPEPAFVEVSDHVPEPCVLHPEQVREYPPDHLLELELAAQVDDWAARHDISHWNHYAGAPGWTASGWPAPFTFRDPPDDGDEETQCGECGGPVDALLTIDSSEWDRDTGQWRPLEDGQDAPKPAGHPYRSTRQPTMVSIGRGYTLQLYYCLTSPRHLPRTIMQ